MHHQNSQNITFLKTLGKGGNATVHLVQNNQKELFACKILPRVLDSTKYCQQKIQNHHQNIKKEIFILQKLKHKSSVVQINDVFEDQDNTYILMDYCQGGSIKDFLNNHNTYTENDIKKIIKKVLEIIAECHDHDVIHNDIKPENFLLKTPDDLNSLVLIDFGISTSSDNPHPNAFEGTPWYMCRESLESKISKKTDIWSVGVMAHLFLTGTFPFNDKTNPYNPSIYKIWNSIINDKLDFSHTKWKNISDQGKSFIERLLQKDPLQRPSVYEALMDPWITDRVDVNHKIGEFIVENIQKYSKKNIVMRTVLEELNCSHYPL